MHRLPPIQSLVTFEATGRLLSFKKASEELHITPSAVSQQIKQLEGWLSLKLFERGNRCISLTEAGEFYYNAASRIISDYHLSHQALIEKFHTATIKLDVSTTLWTDLIQPNIDEISDKLSGFDLTFNISDEIADLDRDRLHFAIRFGNGNWPNTLSKQLKSSHVVVACSQKHHQNNPILSFQEIPLHRLLTFSGWPEAWGWLFNEMGLATKNSKDALVFDNWNTMIQAAEAGTGLLMCDGDVLREKFQQKTLLQLFDINIPMPGPFGYYFVYPARFESNPDMLAVQRIVKELLCRP